MELPKLLVSGKFTPEDLIVSVNPSNRSTDPSVEAQLENIWNEKVKKAEEAGKVCYNGISYRLNGIQEKDGKVLIDFGTFEYKVRDGLIAIPEYFNLPEAYHRRGCFSTATIRTSDDLYLMVELSGKSMNENKTDLIGGIMETDIEMTTGADVFTSFYNELFEEAGVHQSDVSENYLNSIYLTYRTNVGFYFEVTLKIPYREIHARFKNNNDIDIKSIRSFSRDEYLDTLNSSQNPDKPFIATLLMI